LSFFIAKTLKKNTHFTMKKTIICSYINYVHVSGVESIDNNIVEFKNGQSFTKLKGIKPAVYTSTTDPTTAGTILHETVSITAYSDEAAGLINSRQYYILQAVTSDSNRQLRSLIPDVICHLHHPSNWLSLHYKLKCND